MNEKYWQTKTVIDFLSVAEVQKVLEYCKRNFPKAYKRIQPNEADSIKAIEEVLSDIINGRPIVLKKVMDTIEHDILLRTLVKFKKQVKAAHFLGLREQTLRYKMMRLKIPSSRDNEEPITRKEKAQ
jgi:DNA-binding protein Fis